jgi:polyribonucleotide 5'-hydroxyl-kinase
LFISFSIEYLTSTYLNLASALLNHLLSVSHAEDVEEGDKIHIMDTNIAGYLVVTKVDTEKGTLTVLSPQPKPLPHYVFLASDVQFLDLK